MKRKKNALIIIISLVLTISVYFYFSLTSIKAEEPVVNSSKAYQLASNGTGIVAKNIGKTMTDIQGYSGDTNAIKKMILADTGAKAYGLSGNTVVDVTNKIQIKDLADLDKVSTNELKEFHITLTVSASDAGTTNDLTTEVIVYIGNVTKVSTWSELDAAMKSTTVTIIDVQNSMTNTTPARVDYALADKRPDYVLLGNGYSLDFINYSYRWTNTTTYIHKPVVDNLDMYGGNYYGPITMWNQSAYGSSITYRNVNYTGSQVTASFQAVIRFEGKNVIKSKATQYTSYDGTLRNMPNTNQCGLESHTCVFGANTDTTIEAENGDGVILGSYYSNIAPVDGIQPSLTLEENAKATIRTLGNTGESYSFGTTGPTIYSVVSVQRNGKIDIGKNANLNIEEADGTTRVPVRLAPANISAWSTSLNLQESSKLNISINGPISSGYAGIMMGDTSAINVGDKAEMVINAKQMTTGASVISMGTSAQFSVAEKGSLVLNKDGGIGSLLVLSTGSKFNVSDLGSAQFTSTNEGTSSSSMIYGGTGSSFIIGDKGTFEAVIKNGSGARNMLDFGSNTNFQFANANKVDLDARGNPNVNLINMTNPGTFVADIQEVSAWSKADASQEKATFNWTPMYGMSIGYDGTTTTNVSGNSVSKAIQNSFITNYRTENFSRVVYDYIPDVEMGFNPPNDNKSLIGGQQLTGTVNNGAAILFYLVTDENDPSKDVLLTTATVNSPVEGDTKKYHTIADNTGKFTYVLPKDVTLKAGQKIKAYAWLNGKDTSVIQTVLDKTPPEGTAVNYQVTVNDPTPTPDKFVANPTDTNPVPQKFTYAFNEETPQTMVDGYMSQLGEHTVKVDLSDEAGNTTTITSKLTVNEASQAILASNFDAPYVDIRNLSEEQLKSYILTQSHASAYKITNGQKDDLSSLITVSDLGGLSDTENLQAKSYTVTLLISAASSGLPTDISKTIQVTVVDVDAVLTVEFINEANQVLQGYTVTVDTQVGNIIDLTQTSSVKTQVEKVIAAGYEIAERPSNETAVKVDNTALTVKYKLQGVLSLTSVPSMLDFGTLSYDATTKRVENPSFDEQLIVTDTRVDAKNGWQLTASLTTAMHNKSGQELVNALRYVNQGKETILNTDSQVIYTNTKGVPGSYTISEDWGKVANTDGIKLQIDSANVVYTGDYTGVITWKVMAGQP